MKNNIPAVSAVHSSTAEGNHSVAVKQTDRSDVMCLGREQCCWKGKAGATGGHWWIGRVQIWWIYWLTWATHRNTLILMPANTHSFKLAFLSVQRQLVCRCHILAQLLVYSLGILNTLKWNALPIHWECIHWFLRHHAHAVSNYFTF